MILGVKKLYFSIPVASIHPEASSRHAATYKHTARLLSEFYDLRNKICIFVSVASIHPEASSRHAATYKQKQRSLNEFYDLRSKICIEVTGLEL